MTLLTIVMKQDLMISTSLMLLTIPMLGKESNHYVNVCLYLLLFIVSSLLILLDLQDSHLDVLLKI